MLRYIYKLKVGITPDIFLKIKDNIPETVTKTEIKNNVLFISGTYCCYPDESKKMFEKIKKNIRSWLEIRSIRLVYLIDKSLY
jgi:hypothetical protein